MIQLIEFVYRLLWGDLFSIPLPGGGSLQLSFMVVLLIPAGIYFTIRTRFLPVRMFPEMLRVTLDKHPQREGGALSSLQTLVVATATRVGMGNLVGVVAAISAGGAGAVFWMWITALIGSSTAFVEATLAQLHKEKIPCTAAIGADRPTLSGTSLPPGIPNPPRRAAALGRYSLPCPA